MFASVGADLISMSFFKVLFRLWSVTYQLLLQGELRALQITPGHPLLPHPVPQSSCRKTTHVGFEGPVSLTHGCVLKRIQLNVLFQCLGSGGLGFLFTVYGESHSGLLLACNPPPHLNFSSLPLFDFIKSTATGKLWSQNRAGLLAGIKLSLLKPEENLVRVKELIQGRLGSSVG